MAELLEYKCPCCGGDVEFNAGTQQMKCPYCDSEFSVEALREYNETMQQQSEEDMTWETPDTAWQGEETNGMLVYTCESCGGELIAEQTTAASRCPYCDNPVVMAGQLHGALRPDCVIPFKLDREAAKTALRRHFEGKRLLPKVFRDQHRLDEIKGVYVPVWLFDAKTDGTVTFKAERIRRWSDHMFDYKEISYFHVIRSGRLAFERVPVDGSTKMDDTLMEAIEPFRPEDAVDFQTAYLSGYLADKYDVGAEESVSRANERVKKSVELVFKDTVRGYDSVNLDSSSIRLENGTVRYALYPVWLLNVSWNGELYRFAMNGQTGKFVGNLPVDKIKATLWFIGVFVVVAVVVFFLLY